MHEIRRYRKDPTTTIYATEDPDNAYIIFTENDAPLVITENDIDCIDLLEIARDMINKETAFQSKYKNEKLYALSRIEYALRILSTLK